MVHIDCGLSQISTSQGSTCPPPAQLYDHDTSFCTHRTHCLLYSLINLGDVAPL